MKQVTRRLTSSIGLVTILGVLLVVAAPAVAQIKEPSDRDKAVAQRVALFLNHVHIRGKQLDDEISGYIFDSYFGTLDPLRMYFLQSDIDEFGKHREDLDDKLNEGDLSFAFAVYERYLERVGDAEKMINELVGDEIDFDVDEFAEADRTEAAFPKDEKAKRELWRKRVKLLILERLAGDEELKEARERVGKIYKDFFERMRQANNWELLQTFLTSATTTYDPHTTYLSPDTLENFEISMRLQLEGIGAALTTTDGYVVVSEVIPGGAAARDGTLKATDKILAAAEGGAKSDKTEWVDFFNMRLSDVVKHIRGKRGTRVRLKIKSEDTGETKVLELVRAKVVLKDREARGEIFEVGDDSSGGKIKVGIIDLPSFYMDLNAKNRKSGKSKSTTRDVQRILEGFKKENIDAVVVDLRFNGGGSLREAIDMTGLFIDKGPVVQIKRPRGETDVQHDEKSGMIWDGPLVVMTSKLSASASEIFAGAIKDYDRGLLVGDQTTHGKGSVQELIGLDRRRVQRDQDKLGAIKITISKFYRPSGASTQNKGVEPHIELPSLRSHLDIGESDLDFALEFDRVKPAKFTKYPHVPTALVGELLAKSKERVSKSEKFAEVRKDIERYLKVKDRKQTPLKKSKFFEDYKRKKAQQDAIASGHKAGGEKKKDDSSKKKDGDNKDTPEKGDDPKVAKKDDPSAKKGEEPKQDEAKKEGILRDYYLDEVLAITREYTAALRSS